MAERPGRQREQEGWISGCAALHDRIRGFTEQSLREAKREL